LTIFINFQHALCKQFSGFDFSAKFWYAINTMPETFNLRSDSLSLILVLHINSIPEKKHVKVI
jgi:hypothetical protein